MIKSMKMEIANVVDSMAFKLTDSYDWVTDPHNANKMTMNYIGTLDD